MIRKLKIKFVTLAMSALLCLLTVLIMGMNLINYNSVVDECDEILTLLSQNKGTFPGSLEPPMGKPHPDISPETPYESRYFSVLLSEDGQVISTSTDNIASVDIETAQSYGTEIFEKGSERGFADRFRYAVSRGTEGTRITFLDCGRRLDALQSFLWSGIIMSVIGLAVAFAVIVIMSGRIISPIAESYSKQRRFITDAGHEIKTPLTIINANVDILELEMGEDNESLLDIKQQTLRLRSLTEDLVMLARMEESEQGLQKIDFPLSELVSEAALPFRAPATSRGKCLSCSIQPMLSLNGNARSIEQLVSILLDNALKYSPAGSEIRLSLAKKGKCAVLTVTNPVMSEMSQSLSPDQLKHVFDRFYRIDSSRNSETGGHGIGLSVARAIVTSHGGTITATATPDDGFTITAELPGAGMNNI